MALLSETRRNLRGWGTQCGCMEGHAALDGFLIVTSLCMVSTTTHTHTCTHSHAHTLKDPGALGIVLHLSLGALADPSGPQLLSSVKGGSVPKHELRIQWDRPSCSLTSAEVAIMTLFLCAAALSTGDI